MGHLIPTVMRVVGNGIVINHPFAFVTLKSYIQYPARDPSILVPERNIEKMTHHASQKPSVGYISNNGLTALL